MQGDCARPWGIVKVDLTERCERILSCKNHGRRLDEGVSQYDAIELATPLCRHGPTLTHADESFAEIQTTACVRDHALGAANLEENSAGLQQACTSPGVLQYSTACILMTSPSKALMQVAE